MKNTEPNASQLGMLAAVNRFAGGREHLRAKHVYGGTVDPVTVQERRDRNKAARKSRRINRRGK